MDMDLNGTYAGGFHVSFVAIMSCPPATLEMHLVDSLSHPRTKTQWVHVGIWYILRAQRGSHISTFRPKYIPCSYMDPLGDKSPTSKVGKRTLLDKDAPSSFYKSSIHPWVPHATLYTHYMTPNYVLPIQPLYNPLFRETASHAWGQWV